MATRLHVIVVCTGNTCRSPIAEGILKKRFASHPEILIGSAGIAAWPGMQATHYAIQAAQEMGINIREHRSSQINSAMVQHATVLITMTQMQANWLKQQFPELRDQIVTVGELARKDAALEIADPMGGSLEGYRQLARQLQQLLQEAYGPLLDILHIRENRTEGKA